MPKARLLADLKVNFRFNVKLKRQDSTTELTSAITSQVSFCSPNSLSRVKDTNSIMPAPKLNPTNLKNRMAMDLKSPLLLAFSGFFMNNPLSLLLRSY